MPREQRLPLLCFIVYLVRVGQAFTWEALAILNDTSDSPILLNGKSGTALLDELMANVNSLGTYKYDGIQEAQIGGKALKASGTFYYKPIDLMRVEVKQFGNKSGSVLVKGLGGKIKAKGGAPMLGIKMSLDPDSKLLQMPNGFSAFDCHLAALFERLKKDVSSGYNLVWAEQSVQLENLERPAIVIESQMASDSGTKVGDRIFVDPTLKVPMKWDQFENGKFRARSSFQNYKMNLQLDDSLFTM